MCQNFSIKNLKVNYYKYKIFFRTGCEIPAEQKSVFLPGWIIKELSLCVCRTLVTYRWYVVEESDASISSCQVFSLLWGTIIHRPTAGIILAPNCFTLVINGDLQCVTSIDVVIWIHLTTWESVNVCWSMVRNHKLCWSLLCWVFYTIALFFENHIQFGAFEIYVLFVE